ncbi:TIGR02301 family protein [Aurantimonas sp. MSK8Z-1]|uniref:TIGR02301 family protein n=1 Tax=Mangrovibrevibacter kandeliae TaxID=2968473 RepID=UPI0021174828|nr:TIGR02301 family protein [Aurantimonas sp. MSK8Z-1]MCW4113933.1 TIGR02301 family protein [Aurantimonas sp. MSK8Z-1]
MLPERRSTPDSVQRSERDLANPLTRAETISMSARRAFRSRPVRALLAGMLVLTSGAPALAAEEGAQPSAEAQEAAISPSGASFLKPLDRLASILGSVHFLRTLCGDPNAQIWRNKMSELIDAQAPNEADRRRLVASFNGGYRAFESTYQQCTPAARLAVDRYLAEGATLSREISARYGN